MLGIPITNLILKFVSSVCNNENHYQGKNATEFFYDGFLIAKATFSKNKQYLAVLDFINNRFMFAVENNKHLRNLGYATQVNVNKKN